MRPFTSSLAASMILLSSLVAGCGSDDPAPASAAGTAGTTAGNAGSAGSAGTGGTGGTGDTGGTSGTSGASGTAGMVTAPPCELKASCNAVDKSCVGLVDNTGAAKAGLRMSQLTYTAPTTLTTGIIASVFSSGLTLNDTTCNQNGTGESNWLLQLDTTAGTIKTGGARISSDPVAIGYSFVDEMIGGLHVAPVVLDAAVDASGAFSTANGADLVFPYFLDATGTQTILLPLKQLKLTNGTISASHNCIGTYNAEGLQVDSSCNPDQSHPGFIDGGSLEAFVTLEDADTVVIAAISQSLCVLLSGDASMYGDGGQPVNKCKRTGGVINFQGDWCAATNAAADSGCSDAVKVRATYAAGSVKIQN